MLNALTMRERRLLLGILTILLLGGVVKWWRWRAQQVEPVPPVEEEEVSLIGGELPGKIPPGISRVGREFPVVTA